MQQSVMLEANEGELLRSECIKRFALPINERIQLQVHDQWMCFPVSRESVKWFAQTKCQYRVVTSSGDLTSRSDAGDNMRLILLSKFLVLDPAFYGPLLSMKAVCYPCCQVAPFVRLVFASLPVRCRQCIECICFGQLSMVAWPCKSCSDCKSVILTTFTAQGPHNEEDDSDDEEMGFSSIYGHSTLPSQRGSKVCVSHSI